MNKTITLIIVALLCTISTNMRAEKVHDSFWGCSFGMTDSIAASELKKAGLEPLIDENGDIYLKDVKIDNANFSLACLIMSPASGTFYKLVGSSSFTKKAEAENAYNSLLSQLRETYPNLQVVRNPQGGEVHQPPHRYRRLQAQPGLPGRDAEGGRMGEGAVPKRRRERRA